MPEPPSLLWLRRDLRRDDHPALAAAAGAARDEAVRQLLSMAGVEWVATGSPYAVTPGRLVNQSGAGYRVFTPFNKAWLAHGWPGPALEPPRAATGISPERPDGVAVARRCTPPNARSCSCRTAPCATQSSTRS